MNKFGYLLKEGFKSIFTHGFMSFASVTIIMACLLIMGSFGLLAINIDNMIGDLESENQILAIVDETYTEAGEPLTIHYYYTETGEVGKIEYIYDGNGNVAEEIHYSLEGEVDTHYYAEYDAAGNRTREEQYGADGTMWGYTTFAYDAAGNLLRDDRYDMNGALEWYYLYEYADGHRTRYECYNGDGALEWYQVNRYDDQGNYLGYDHYDASGNLTQSTVQS